jgi:hypothetical protein
MARASCRRRIEPTEDWEQLELLVCGPSGGNTSLSAHHSSMAWSMAERSRQIEASESRLRCGISGFKNYGMSSLLEPDEVQRHPHFPLRPL